MFINQEPLEHLQGRLLDFTVGPAALTNETFQGKNARFPMLLASSIGARDLTVSITFCGEGRKDTAKNMARFFRRVQAACELYLPDGFFYTCILQGVSEPQAILPSRMTVEYKFLAVRHGPVISHAITESCDMHVDGDLDAEPVFRVQTTGDFTIQGVEIKNITGEVVLDSVRKTITQNGQNKFMDTDLLSFPKLKPGWNSITLSKSAAVTIEYFPIYL